MSRIEDLSYYFQKYASVPTTGVEDFIERAVVRHYSKGQYAIRSGERPSKLILILSGCLMTYYEDEDANPHVLQFGTEYWWTGDLEAFTNTGNSMYSIRAITDTEVMELDVDAFEYLCGTHSEFEKLFRRIFQNPLVSHQKRIMENISSPAEDRYRSFQRSYPKLELTIPQKYIASYLGITPEFLSKLRARK